MIDVIKAKAYFLFQKKAVILGCLFLLFSCSAKHQRNQSTKISYPVIIDMNKGTGDEQVFLNQIIKISQFIQLDSVTDGYVKEATKVRVFENLIYVFDDIQDKLLVFSDQGKFISQVIKRGQGPGEVIDAVDFDLDTIHRQLLVLDLYDKELLVYDLKGNYQFALKNDFQSYYFTCLDGFHRAFYVGYFDRSFHNLILTSEKGKPLASLFDFPKNIMPMGFQCGYLTRNVEGALYSDACSNEVYQIDNEGNTYLKYKIDFGNRTWPEEKRFNFEEFFLEMSRFNIDYLMNHYEENKESFVFQYRCGRKTERAFYDKENEKLFAVGKNLKNDMLYNVLTASKGISEDGSFISVMDPLPVKEELINEKKEGKQIHLNNGLQALILSSNEMNANIILVYFSISPIEL